MTVPVSFEDSLNRFSENLLKPPTGGFKPTLAERVAIAIQLIKRYVPSCYYEVGFSGGKDSQVVWDLVKKSGVPAKAIFNLTTIDPPELLKFIRKEYPEVEFRRPINSMRQLLLKELMPPTRLIRYCCEVLKERPIDTVLGTVTITGVRAAESNSRSKRSMYERDRKNKMRWILHPIFEWEDNDVWSYIKQNNLPYCSLYDEGWKRIGCIMCPMNGDKRMKRDAERWPHIAKMYKMAFARIIEERKKRNLTTWETADAMYEWWVNSRPSSVCGQKQYNYGD
jgi:phosphoadenosine phosphosulfate reductase